MRTRSTLAALLLAAVPLVPGVASADVESKLAAFEQEAKQLGTDLPEPNKPPAGADSHRLVDAEVAFSLGDYDTAALMLFDLTSKPGPDQETATYYLAESLLKKGDHGAARNYFEQVAAPGKESGRYYQTALVRLVEIAIAQRDTSNVANTIAALDRMSPGLRKPEVPYVRGKYAFFEGKYDEALAYFQDVHGSYEMQAQYYAATVYVAKKDLAKATEIYNSLTEKHPKTPNDRRIVELSHMALGRLYYERDQPSKSIDSYLEIDRHSDLFSDALYEVGWVYVKGKQYDKALRALELLSLSEPTSTKTPTVRILEGNLRIRKAQMIRNAKITGTLDATTRDFDPDVEYTKADAVFKDTHDLYLPAYTASSEMADSQDPSQYLQQLAGRTPRVFSTTPPVPEAVIAYVKEEPEAQRVVEVQTDLNEVENNIVESEAVLARLDGVLAAGDKTALYPALQSRRSRVGSLQDDLIKVRIELHDQLARGSGETANRKALAAAYVQLGNVEQLANDRLSAVRADYDKLDESAADVAGILDSTQAMAVAVRRYVNDPKATGTEPVAADLKTTTLTGLDEATKEAESIDKELADLQKELVLGRDLAPVGDDAVVKARDTRKQLIAALDAEQKGFGGGGKAAQLAERAARLSASLSAIDGQIDAAVERGMGTLKATIATERTNIAAMRAELDDSNKEARTIGGTVLGQSFKNVKAKFYDIVIRTDVGAIDVAWARKEDNDDDIKRLNLSRQRDLKQLKDEFRGILDNPTPTSGGKPLTKRPDMPEAIKDQPQQSPDKGGTAPRVSPGGPNDNKEPAKPTVKPDEKKAPAPAPKAPAPKTGGAK